MLLGRSNHTVLSGIAPVTHSFLPLGCTMEEMISKIVAQNSLPLFVAACYTLRNTKTVTDASHTLCAVVRKEQPQIVQACIINTDGLGLEYPATEFLGGSGSKARIGEPVTL